MLIVGLTGSIASGKNFVADLFADFGIPVFDADAEVHKIFANDKQVLAEIKEKFPSAIIDNKINRELLGREVFNDAKKLAVLEAIIHPKVQKNERDFIKKSRELGAKIVLLNIPLLFEKDGYKRCDKTIVVTAPYFIQKRRFIAREKVQNSHKIFDNKVAVKKFQQIISKQLNNAARLKMADFVIHNGFGKIYTLWQVKKILRQLSAKR